MFCYLFLVLLASVAVPSSCNSSKLYLEAPSSITINPSVKSISSSDVANVIREILGFTVNSGSSWSGIKSTSPFDVPKAALLIEVQANDDFNLGKDAKHQYNLNWNEDLVDIQKMLSCSFNSEFRKGEAQDVALFDTTDVRSFEADHHELTADIKSSELHATINNAVLKSGISLTSTGVPSFLSELNYLLRLTDQIAAKAMSHGLFVFRINTFKDFINTDQISPAMSILKIVLDQMTENVKKAYNNEVVIVTQVVDLEHVRKVRNILAASTEQPPTPGGDVDIDTWNLAKQYTSDYQNTFAAVLFLLIILTLSILTVSLVMWNMDPGRDSIIYRMTSQRVKMD